MYQERDDGETEPAPKGKRRQKYLKNANTRATVLQRWTDQLTTLNVVFEGLQYDVLGNLCRGFTADQIDSFIHVA